MSVGTVMTQQLSFATILETTENMEPYSLLLAVYINMPDLSMEASFHLHVPAQVDS